MSKYCVRSSRNEKVLNENCLENKSKKNIILKPHKKFAKCIFNSFRGKSWLESKNQQKKTDFKCRLKNVRKCFVNTQMYFHNYEKETKI